MREIKFRGWDKKEKRFVELDGGNYYLVASSHGLVSVRKSGEWDKERYELMQSTGLRDKNGKEIYEGDILQVSTPDKGWRGSVSWATRGWRLNDTDLWRYEISCIEIIGNIYENPELIS